MTIHSPSEALTKLANSSELAPTLFFDGTGYEVQSAAKHVAPTEGFYPILSLNSLATWCNDDFSEKSLSAASEWLKQHQAEWLSVAMENGLD